MAEMRIAGEVFTIPDKTPAPKPKRGRPAAKKPSADALASDQASSQS